MKIDPQKRIGGGHNRHIQISDRGTIKKVPARGGLFGGDIYVISAGSHMHKIAIPNWDNMVARAALQDDSYCPGYHDPSWLVYMVFASVYEALRYTYYVLDVQYGLSFRHGEKGRLTIARQELIELNAVAAGLRTGNAAELAPQFLEKARATLEQIEERPRDIAKQKTREKTVPLATVHDSLGRVNQTAKMAQAISAYDWAGKRLVSIGKIEPVIIARRQTLMALIQEMELFWEGLYNYLTKLFDRQHWIRGKTRCMHLLEQPDTRRQMRQHLLLFQQEIGRYDVEPFTKTSYHVHQELRTAIQYIGEGKYGGAKKLLQRIWNSLKLRHMRAKLEHAMIPFTVSLAQSQLQAATFDDLIFVTRRARRQLQTVDETGFSQPVTTHVRGQLSAAIDCLIKKTITDGNNAKQHLKQALSVL